MAARLRVATNSAAGSSVTVTLTPQSGVTAGIGHSKCRILKVYVHYYGGATDASMIKITVPAKEIGNAIFRKPCTVSGAAGAPGSAEWNFDPGFYIIDGGAGIPVALVTAADAAAAAPTILIATVVFSEE